MPSPTTTTRGYYNPEKTSGVRWASFRYSRSQFVITSEYSISKNEDYGTSLLFMRSAGLRASYDVLVARLAGDLETLEIKDYLRCVLVFPAQLLRGFPLLNVLTLGHAPSPEKSSTCFAASFSTSSALLAAKTSSDCPLATAIFEPPNPNLP